MKKFRYCAAAIIFAILITCFSGCIEIKNVPGKTPESASPEQSIIITTDSPEISPAESQVVMPEDELIQPGYDVKASVLYDINGDGVKETISVGLGDEREIGNDILLSVSDNGAFNTVTMDTGYFESADYLFTPGGAFCIAVCHSFEDDYSYTTLVSFDGLKPVVKNSVPGKVVEFSDSGITVNDWIDALGTWPCYGYYNVTDAFSFERSGDFFIISDGLEPLITKAGIPADVWKDGGYTAETLKPGTALYPTVTDGETYMNFRLKDDTDVMIRFTRSNYECFINGVNENDCFETVPYAG